MEQAERVIFREYKDPYMPGVPHYLAVFPDDKANPGRICCTPFYFGKRYDFLEGELAIFEPVCECDYGYYYSTKIIHRKDPRAEKLLKTVSEYYKAPFRIVEKLTH